MLLEKFDSVLLSIFIGYENTSELIPAWFTLFTPEWKIHAVCFFFCLILSQSTLLPPSLPPFPSFHPSCLALCRRRRLGSEGGEHHSRELVDGGSGARGAASFSGFCAQFGYSHKFRTSTTQAHTVSVAVLLLRAWKILIMPLLHTVIVAINQHFVVFTPTPLR